MKVTKAVKLNKMLYKIKKMLEDVIAVSDVLASGVAEAKPLKLAKEKVVKKAKAKSNKAKK